MFCGAPVIIPKRGGLPEIITESVDGYACFSEQDYMDAIQNVHKLTPEKTHLEVVEKYKPETVASGYLELFKQVKGGLRWT